MNLVYVIEYQLMFFTSCWLAQSICSHSVYVLVILDMKATITKRFEEGTEFTFEGERERKDSVYSNSSSRLLKQRDIFIQLK